MSIVVVLGVVVCIRGHPWVVFVCVRLWKVRSGADGLRVRDCPLLYRVPFLIPFKHRVQKLHVNPNIHRYEKNKCTPRILKSYAYNRRVFLHS